MIEDKLILSRAKELGIKITEEEISDKLEYIKGGFPSEKDFYNILFALSEFLPMFLIIFCCF